MKPTAIIGSRTTDQGLIVRFSDGQFYLFSNKFLSDHRDQDADHVPSGSPWLAENWKRREAAPPRADLAAASVNRIGRAIDAARCAQTYLCAG